MSDLLPVVCTDRIIVKNTFLEFAEDDEEVPRKLTKPSTTPPRLPSDASESTIGPDDIQEMPVSHSTTTADPDVEVPGTHDSASAPAPPPIGRTGFRCWSGVNGRQYMQWRILQSKVKPNFEKHKSPRVACTLKGIMCEIMIILKEVRVDDANKDSARRDRRNLAASSCTIEVVLLKGLEDCPDGILTYSVFMGSGAKQTQPRQETHDFQKSSSCGQEDSDGHVEWNHMEAVDDATKTLDVFLEFMP